ncbi:Multicopper oxidase [Modestobacter sp. DSM 44400]|uniref:multicopper oxidase domain-containing protein n=1 Tax=Modestobacter sp. DSM 44400 TaxID=1550230 RepID=UPI000896940C|nr:multicopper oxidase domain-containing protein [Modestobacter sp. DSM 44400]SDY80316.1 Multicopper oxidase [Modestobacter sp. DSM 44400]
MLAPGNRADLRVTTTEGASSLELLGVDRGAMGAMGGMMGGSAAGDVGPVAALQVTGAAVAGLPALPAQPAPRDLRNAEPATRRRLVFDMGMGTGSGGMSFTIDGKEFDPDRVDQSVNLGAMEEWTIANTSPMDHPMHLHVWPMQIVAEAGRPIDDIRWQDVVNIPAAGGEVTVRVAFDQFGGRTVYHCHILDHEDRGMMGVIEAQQPPG